MYAFCLHLGKYFVKNLIIYGAYIIYMNNSQIYEYSYVCIYMRIFYHIMWLPLGNQKENT